MAVKRRAINGRVIHVRGTHNTLERSLRRFPTKPLDLADAAYWGWYDMLGNVAGKAVVGSLANRRVATQVAQTQQQEFSLLHYKGTRSFPLLTSKYQWHISPGWQRKVVSTLAEHVVHKFPGHFEVIDG